MSRIDDVDKGLGNVIESFFIWTGDLLVIVAYVAVGDDDIRLVRMCAYVWYIDGLFSGGVLTLI